MSRSIFKRTGRLASALALVALVFAMGGTWTAVAAPATTPATGALPGAVGVVGPIVDGGAKPAKKEVIGRLNLNTATETQLMLLPTVGPSKAERIVAWRKKNGGFRRTADLRRVKGFGYRTFKRLEPFLDIKGDTTLAAKR